MDQSNNNVYFLGFDGEQSGPYSLSDITSRISEGKITPDTLIWWEGQSDWQLISVTPEFQNLFQTKPLPPPATKRPPDVSSNSSSPVKKIASWTASYRAPGESPKPIYTKNESLFSTSLRVPLKWSLSLTGAGLLGLFAWVTLVFLSPEQPNQTVNKKKSRKEQILLSRRSDFEKASALLVLEPNKSLETLNQLIDQDSSDEIGKESIRLLLSHLSKNKDYGGLGKVYLKLNQPEKAAESFLKDPKLSSQAESALFAAYKTASGKTKADLLLKNIQILISPLEQYPLASERIALFEKTFPALSHPYSYYQQPPTDRAIHIFSKLKPYFVKILGSHIQDEFPQLTLVGPPQVELKRDIRNNWRVIGSYRGDVLLRSDKLKNIYFVYWLIDNQWLLVDTNLTPERSQFASDLRKRYAESNLNLSSLLELLEQLHKRQFPGLGLHESAPINTKKR